MEAQVVEGLKAGVRSEVSAIVLLIAISTL
jgi:hypothetical protein